MEGRWTSKFGGGLRSVHERMRGYNKENILLVQSVSCCFAWNFCIVEISKYVFSTGPVITGHRPKPYCAPPPLSFFWARGRVVEPLTKFSKEWNRGGGGGRRRIDRVKVKLYFLSSCPNLILMTTILINKTWCIDVSKEKKQVE